ncbi:hypothetical protein STA3757_15290 [Stanieria sp. NIES-3757]|nr:hypothetical protein STA3757_15290 [Stanieria sp. NIES-3757]
MNNTSPKKVWSRINILALVRFLLVLACGWGILQVLAYFENIITIFSFAAIIAFLLTDVTQKL